MCVVMNKKEGASHITTHLHSILTTISNTIIDAPGAAGR